MLYHKEYEWNHEKEYRAVWDANSYDNDYWEIVSEEDGSTKTFLKCKAVSVTFGYLSYRNEQYANALELLKNINDNIKYRKDQIIVRRCELSDKKYMLIYDNQYNYLEELARL